MYGTQKTLNNQKSKKNKARDVTLSDREITLIDSQICSAVQQWALIIRAMKVNCVFETKTHREQCNRVENPEINPQMHNWLMLTLTDVSNTMVKEYFLQ